MPPDRWLELAVRVAPDGESPNLPEAVSELLLALGGLAVEEREVSLLTYLKPPPVLEDFLAMVRDRLHEIQGSRSLTLEWRWQAQEDWETYWRQGLGPRRITSRLVVSPSWEEVRTAPGEILVTLDPGMAFGTAEHATTRGSLRLLDRMVTPACRLVDVGSGSGILSIAAARLGAAEVLALDMDPLACETALENVALNQVGDRVRVDQSHVRCDSPLPGGLWDGVVANIQSAVLIPLLPSFRESLDPAGWMILSGVLQHEADTVLTAAAEQGFSLVETDLEDGWWTGSFRLSLS